jgi:hypothetical protein
MTTMTPFQRVQQLHGGKEQLVDKITDVLERGEESKEDRKKRLQSSSNTKLLRLLEAATELKDRFGTKEKLVDAILAKMGRQKDADFRKKLLVWTPARLLDLHRSKERAAKAKA